MCRLAVGGDRYTVPRIRLLNDPDPIGNDFRYTGRTTEGDGLYYYRARYHSASMRRFISPDPIGFAGGSANLYRYAINDPINFVDPHGKLAVAGTIAAAIAIRAAVGAVSSAIATKAAGGSDASAARNALIGGVAGGIVPGGATVARVVATNAAVGGATSAVSQGATIIADPCLGAEDFNYGAVAGSVVGGALAGRANLAGLGAHGSAVKRSLTSAVGVGRATGFAAASSGIGAGVGAR